MIAAKEARNKVLQNVMEDEEFKKLIDHINKEVEYEVNHCNLSGDIFINHTLPFILTEALKTYYTDLGYNFDYRANYQTETCNIYLKW